MTSEAHRTYRRLSVPRVNAAENRDYTTHAVCLEEWFIQQVLGYCDSLKKDVFWRGNSSQIAAAVVDVDRQVLALMEDCLDCPEPEYCPENGACPAEYFPDHLAFTLEPQDPFTEPEEIPSGYFAPPFWKGSDPPGAAEWMLQLEPTDIITDISQWRDLIPSPIGILFPIEAVLDWLHILGLAESGFPRATFHFSGAGKLQFHVIKIPFGGLAMITVDSAPTSAKFVDLSTIDLSEVLDVTGILTPILGAVTGTLFKTEIFEIEVNEPGNHHATITFLPNMKSLSDLVPGLYGLVAWGGGLRKVTLCGENAEARFDMSNLTTEICEDGQSFRFVKVSDGSPIGDCIPLPVPAFVAGESLPPGSDPEVELVADMTWEISPVTGNHGIDGQDGQDGINGIDGQDGINGIDGQDGINGIDGQDGTNGITPVVNMLGTTIRIDSNADGNYDYVVNLKGDKGDPGDGRLWYFPAVEDTTQLNLLHTCAGVNTLCDVIFGLYDDVQGESALARAGAKTTADAIISISLLFTAGVSIISKPIIDFFLNVSDTEAAAIAAALDNEWRANRKRDLYCRIANNENRLTEEVWNTWREDDVTNSSGVAGIVRHDMSNFIGDLFGWDEISNRYMIYAKDVSFICELWNDCIEEPEPECLNNVMDFTLSQACATPRTGTCFSGSGVWGEWESGVGFKSISCIEGAMPAHAHYKRIQLWVDLGEVIDITHIRYKWSGDSVTQEQIFLGTPNSTIGSAIHTGSNSPGEKNVTVGTTTRYLLFVLERSGTVASPPPGNWTLQEIEITGTPA